MVCLSGLLGIDVYKPIYAWSCMIGSLSNIISYNFSLFWGWRCLILRGYHLTCHYVHNGVGDAVYDFMCCSDVRSKAFQAVEQFLQIMKQYHEKVLFLSFTSFLLAICINYFSLGIWTHDFGFSLRFHMVPLGDHHISFAWHREWNHSAQEMQNCIPWVLQSQGLFLFDFWYLGLMLLLDGSWSSI